MDMLTGVLLGFAAWFAVRFVLTGWYTVGPNERAVKTVFGRAQRLGNLTSLDDVIAESLRETERERYCYPQVRVILPGGPYFKCQHHPEHGRAPGRDRVRQSLGRAAGHRRPGDGGHLPRHRGGADDVRDSGNTADRGG